MQDIEKAMELESNNPEFLFTAVRAQDWLAGSQEHVSLTDGRNSVCSACTKVDGAYATADSVE